MKKPRLKRNAFLVRQIRLRQRKSALKSNLIRHRAYGSNRRKKIIDVTSKPYIIQQREKFRKKLYRQYQYKKVLKNVKIIEEFGIEETKGIDSFLNKATEIIDFNSKKLEFDISKCPRIWPSAITLLCSLKQWVELCTSKYRSPVLSSNSSDFNTVNGYLNHCGFHEYVNRPKDEVDVKYDEREVVKIHREKHVRNIETRENQILSLVESYSVLSPDEIEWFNCVVLTEAFNNVTEHGVSNRDNGWWLLGQRHPTHKMISLCIADNGIGFRHTLMTGPQRGDLIKKYKNSPSNDGEFIKLAMEENISGAIYASTAQGKYIKSYDRGARRGNGLKRIFKTCSELKIKLSILSHYGYIFL